MTENNVGSRTLGQEWCSYFTSDSSTTSRGSHLLETELFIVVFKGCPALCVVRKL